ncbi:phosphatase PAP2 family protein [Aureimonas sp. AU4]|uniref:phosphatase PAP2 family protein n=1 Tax=Aureimonas sp. AU4 TaxID=1638163 RepID=UPI0007801EAD|nr:phosphatase PAP2 family protein [Aureimonas sp. AU4]
MMPASSAPTLGGNAGFRLERNLLRADLRRDAPIHVLILSYAAIVWPLIGARLLDWMRPLAEQGVQFVALFLATAVVLRLVVYVTRLHPVSPIRQLAADAGEGLRSGLWSRWIPLAFTTSVFIFCFTQFKGGIPALAGGFHWDAAFAEMDRTLHFGRQPWEWLQPVLGWPLVTFVINVNYNMWFFFMWCMFFAFAVRPAGERGRTRFFLAFFLTWMVAGSLLALVFSSAGPCYFGFVAAGENPYAGLMAYLHEAGTRFPLWALDVQDMLWADYRSGSGDFGISAMPSLHNAMALLMVLAARDLHPRLRPWLVVHMILVFLGSIHLGWHYAVDAYASFAVTALIWFAVTPFARRWDARFAPAS